MTVGEWLQPGKAGTIRSMRTNWIAALAAVASMECGRASGGGPEGGADALSAIKQAYPNLASDDPRELAMKVRSLLRDEYTYFRGSAPAFYQALKDLADDWAADRMMWVRLHGDVHIGNIGTYQGPGAEGRDIRFGVVDFDETQEGPFPFDLLRGLTALRFAWRAPESSPVWEEAAQAMCDGYRSGLTGAGTAYAAIVEEASVRLLLRRAAKNTSADYLARFVTPGPSPRFRPARVKDGEVRDILEPPSTEVHEQIIEAVWEYIQQGCGEEARAAFRAATIEELRTTVLDVARWTRTGSSGSQGVHKFFVLLKQPLTNSPSDVILELKEQPTPAAARVGLLPAADGVRRAEEVARAHATLLSPPPRLVGFTRIGQRGFLVRARDPWAEELDTGDFGGAGQIRGAVAAARVAGAAVGMAHQVALVQQGQPDKISYFLERLDGMAIQLAHRSAKMESRIRRDFAALQGDPEARKLAAEADEFVRAFKR
jgi:uncharacterized protein (DUF2252 family)